MYIPGRSRTGSRPFRTEMSLAVVRHAMAPPAGADGRGRWPPRRWPTRRRFAREKPGQRGLAGLISLPESIDRPRESVSRAARRRPSPPQDDTGPEHLVPGRRRRPRGSAAGSPTPGRRRSPCRRRRAPNGRARAGDHGSDDLPPQRDGRARRRSGIRVGATSASARVAARASRSGIGSSDLVAPPAIPSSMMRPASTRRRCSGWMPAGGATRGRQQRLPGGRGASRAAAAARRAR